MDLTDRSIHFSIIKPEAEQKAQHSFGVHLMCTVTNLLQIFSLFQEMNSLISLRHVLVQITIPKGDFTFGLVTSGYRDDQDKTR